MRKTALIMVLPAIMLSSAIAVAEDEAGPTAANDPAKTDTAAQPATEAPKAKGKLTDAQIFGVLTAANAGEIDAANLATSTSANDDVKKFAAEMVKDHTAMNDEGSALAQKLQITPAESATSASLKASSEKEMTHLRTLTGMAFDKAYAHAAVVDHRAVLRLIDKKLMTAATNPDVKNLLKGARPKVAEHLKHAMHLQAALRKTKSEVGDNP